MAGRRMAILIGNSRFERDWLPNLKDPTVHIDPMKQVLTDSGRFERVDTLLERSPAEIERRLVTSFRTAQPDDLLIVYYSGHVLIDGEHRAYLAGATTDPDDVWRSAVSLADVCAAIPRDVPRRVVLLLDALYSTAILGTFVFRKLVENRLDAISRSTGVYLITSAVRIADDPHNLRVLEPALAAHITDGLPSGEADEDGDGRITVDDLYGYVLRRVPTGTKPAPHRSNLGPRNADMVLAETRRGFTSSSDRGSPAAWPPVTPTLPVNPPAQTFGRTLIVVSDSLLVRPNPDPVLRRLKKALDKVLEDWTVTHLPAAAFDGARGPEVLFGCLRATDVEIGTASKLLQQGIPVILLSEHSMDARGHEQIGACLARYGIPIPQYGAARDVSRLLFTIRAPVEVRGAVRWIAHYYDAMKEQAFKFRRDREAANEGTLLVNIVAQQFPQQAARGAV